MFSSTQQILVRLVKMNIFHVNIRRGVLCFSQGGRMRYPGCYLNHAFLSSIDPSHKSHNASDKYPTMHYFATELCTHVHISVTKWCIMGYGTFALWDLCHTSFAPFWINHDVWIKIETFSSKREFKRAYYWVKDNHICSGLISPWYMSN